MERDEQGGAREIGSCRGEEQIPSRLPAALRTPCLPVFRGKRLLLAAAVLEEKKRRFWRKGDPIMGEAEEAARYLRRLLAGRAPGAGSALGEQLADVLLLRQTPNPLLLIVYRHRARA